MTGLVNLRHDPRQRAADARELLEPPLADPALEIADGGDRGRATLVGSTAVRARLEDAQVSSDLARVFGDARRAHTLERCTSSLQRHLR